MNAAWVIRPIRAEEVAEARRIIYKVVHVLMEPEASLEGITARWDAWGVFSDLDDVQTSYFENGGVFLVAVDGVKIVGTGAFHPDTEGVCELRRIALLPEYRGQGLGYAMLLEIMRRARTMGYAKMRLWTNRYKLFRAVAFYHQVGFVDVPHEGADEEELWMEMGIPPILGGILPLRSL